MNKIQTRKIILLINKKKEMISKKGTTKNNES